MEYFGVGDGIWVLRADSDNEAVEMEREHDGTLARFVRFFGNTSPMAREHHTFRSTRVTEGWYDNDRREIRVRFPDGTYWRYLDVPPIVWSDFIHAQSAGTFLNAVLTKAYRNKPA